MKQLTIHHISPNFVISPAKEQNCSYCEGVNSFDFKFVYVFMFSISLNINVNFNENVDVRLRIYYYHRNIHCAYIQTSPFYS